MANSMIHFNNDILCAIDTETTGFTHGFHEIVQLAIVPLDSNIIPRTDVPSLDIFISPDYPERWSKKAKNVINKVDLQKILKIGIDREKAKDVLSDWIDKLDIPMSSGGVYRKRIVPLGYNYQFDLGHMLDWLGDDLYTEWFGHDYRDCYRYVLSRNDEAAMDNAPKIPFPKTTLTSVASRLEIDTEYAHNALQDCIMTAEVYRKLTTQKTWRSLCGR